MPAFAGDFDAGEQVFAGNCAACHAGGQNVIMPEKTLELVRRPTPARAVQMLRRAPRARTLAHAGTAAQSALKEYRDGGPKEASVATQASAPLRESPLPGAARAHVHRAAWLLLQVTNGKNAMPAFGGRLSGDDIANVATYVIQSANDGW